jgi:hypothetical protein
MFGIKKIENGGRVHKQALFSVSIFVLSTFSQKEKAANLVKHKNPHPEYSLVKIFLSLISQIHNFLSQIFFIYLKDLILISKDCS